MSASIALLAINFRIIIVSFGASLMRNSRRTVRRAARYRTMRQGGGCSTG
jgi:hypothetical protein